MAHIVKCKVCGESFDTDTTESLLVGYRRYAHKDCAEKEGLVEYIPQKEEKAEQKKRKTDLVKCKYCSEQLYKTDEDCIKVGKRYAHQKCYDTVPQAVKDEEKFYEYCSSLFGKSYDYLKTKKLAEKYLREYSGWSWIGMTQSLRYFYEEKKNSIEKSNGTIGILPYIYQEAYNYYYNIWLVRQQIEKIDTEEFITNTINITIPTPEYSGRKRNNFLKFDGEE